MHTSFPERMNKLQSKMKALEWSQHFFHCKLSDPQGQLTLQFMVGSGQIQTQPRLSSFPPYLKAKKQIQQKMKVLEC